MKQKTMHLVSLILNNDSTHHAPANSEIFLCVLDPEAWCCTQTYITLFALISEFSSCFLPSTHYTPPCLFLLCCCNIRWKVSLYQT